MLVEEYCSVLHALLNCLNSTKIDMLQSSYLQLGRYDEMIRCIYNVFLIPEVQQEQYHTYFEYDIGVASFCLHSLFYNFPYFPFIGKLSIGFK